MSVAKLDDNRKVTTHRLIEMKQRGEKISMLTAYDFSMAKLIERDFGGRFRLECDGWKRNDFADHARPDDLSWKVGRKGC